MTKQGAPAQQPRPDDGWWDTVYAGPAGTLPDTPDARPGEGSVDDWFDTAAGLIGQQRSASGEAGAAAEAETVEGTAEADEGVLERDSIDDWFDTAVGVITPRRPAEQAGLAADVQAADVPADAVPVEDVPTADDTRRFPAPAWAAGPAALVELPEATDPPTDRATEPAPRVPEPRPKPAPETASAPALEPEPEPEPEPAPAAEPEPAATEAVVPEPDREPAPAPEPDPEPVVAVEPPAPRPNPRPGRAATAPVVPHVGERPPTYGPEPTALPEADPGALGGVVADTVLEGAQYAATTLRAVSVRGDSARYRGEPRRDSLLVTRFGEGADGLLLAVLGGLDHAGPVAEEVATATAEACRQLAGAVGRSREGLSADLRDGARDRLRYGLQRLALSAVAPLRALVPDGGTVGGPADEPDGEGEPSPASLHCLLASLDPAAGYRAAFGVGPGGLYLLRSGHWIDAYAARLLHHPEGQPPVPEAPAPGPRPFRFRMVPATPGDILLLCTPGLARPIADEPAVAHFLASHWAHPHPPGTVDFLRQVQVRAKGYTDDRTAAAIWTE
ncbi:hypothetical protein ACFP3U_02670 [Kitasatospora misakiensis]|uniref:PPM-type phosphatase domain-containing protein n=1 Tax=Kitasatospora misakiensis TaxID=67330 RepID=A0ABW0WUC7_9ACTN